MKLEAKQEKEFTYFEEGSGDVIIPLHGLFGALSNFTDLIHYFLPKYRVIIPILPFYNNGEQVQATVTGMVDYIEAFFDFKKLDKVHLIGNSLGGHISLLYYLRHPEKVKTMTLTGSSGLFENSLGETYPRRSEKDYVQKKTEATFYDPKHATPELVDDVYSVVNDRSKIIRMITLAKSAIRNNLREEIPAIKLPVCLIWGKNDTVTPPMVAEEFNRLLPDSELHMIDKCGHAAMMEQPGEFNHILELFLKKHT